jgi:hypothetical protein
MSIFYPLPIITCIIAPLWSPPPGRERFVKTKSQTTSAEGKHPVRRPFQSQSVDKEAMVMP